MAMSLIFMEFDMKKFFIVLFTAFFLLPASTQNLFDKINTGTKFRLEPAKDEILLGSGLALSGGDLFLDNVLKINRAEYKGDLYEKQNLNWLDKKFMHSYNENLDTLSDLLVAATMATPGVLIFTDRQEWATEIVMYAETLLIANGTKEMIKLCVNRARPYMYYNAADYPEKDIKDGDWANSFLSGHTTMAFASATFTTYTFSRYFPDSYWKYPVAIASYGLACGTSWLRMQAGCHFATDVICGTILGTGVGFFVPWLHTQTQNTPVNIALLPNGFVCKINL